MINVLLVDDQTLVRQGIFSLLSLSDEVTVVAQASDGQEAFDILQTQSKQIDVVLLDIRMPNLDGIQTMEKIQLAELKIPVIMLTTFDDHESLLKAMQHGAKGYLLKDVSLETLVHAIKTVHKGETMFQPSLTQGLINGLHNATANFEASALPEPLSKRETEILRLMAAGCSNREMANGLFKSEGTIKNQVSSILSKLGVRDRTRAVLKAIELGII